MQHFTTPHDNVAISTGNETGLTLDSQNMIRQDSPDTIMEQKASQLQILVCNISVHNVLLTVSEDIK